MGRGTPEDKDAQPPTPPVTRVSEGNLRFDLTSGRLAAAAAATAVTPRPADARQAERLASVSGVQFVSADGRHILSSQRVSDDRTWDKYQWTVFERATGKPVGLLRDYRSHAPFVVVDAQIVYEVGPYVRRTAGGLVEQPLQIRAVSLATGNEQWSRPVRDTTYRGPLPG